MIKIIPLDGGHTILIVKGLLHTDIFFDSSPMHFCGEESFGRSKEKAFRFASIATEDVHKVTYSLLVIKRFFGFRESIYRVEKFQGDSMLQWHDEIGELIYSSK
jgi:hypothetical protein